jgi:hypothetical protein
VLLQTIWAKSLLISTLDKEIYYVGTFLQGSTKPLFTTQNRVEIAEKNRPFFQHASSSSVAPTISMIRTLTFLSKVNQQQYIRRANRADHQGPMLLF